MYVKLLVFRLSARSDRILRIFSLAGKFHFFFSFFTFFHLSHTTFLSFIFQPVIYKRKENRLKVKTPDDCFVYKGLPDGGIMHEKKKF